MAYETWKRYEFEGRWTSYFQQVNQVLEFKPSSCLEIGVGNGIVTDALKRQGLEVKTLDIDPELKPDIVGSVQNIPLPEGAVDVVLCAEVLEHLSFDQFEICLRELLRVSRRGVVISLPHWGYTIRGVIDLPALPAWRFAWKLPIAKKLEAESVHEWEIGRTGYPLKRILEVIERQAHLEAHWLSPWMPYHHFFRLRKSNI